MLPVPAPKTLKVYSLVKQTGMTFTYTGFSTGSTGISVGTGFFLTQAEAEHHRTIELLKDTGTPRSNYHVFELEVPNPAYQE